MWGLVKKIASDIDWDSLRNSFNAPSEVDNPEGSDFVFADNKIKVSQINKLSLHHATMAQNYIYACAIYNLHLAGSAVDKNKFNGCSLSNIHLKNSQWKNMKSHGVCFNHIDTEDVIFNKLKMHGVQIERSRFAQDIKCNSVNMHGVNIQHTELNNCHWSDSSLQKIKVMHSHIIKLNLQSCTFRNVEFIDCKISNIALDNITITNKRFHGETITSREDLLSSGQTIDAFR